MEVAIFFIASIYPFVPFVPFVANTIYPFVPSVPFVANTIYPFVPCTPLVAHCTFQKGFSTASATMMIAMSAVTELTARK